MKRVFEKQAIAKLNAVSLSDNTIKRRIEEMSDNIADQILAEIRESKFGFAIQLDESTDITNCSRFRLIGSCRDKHYLARFSG